MNGLRDSGETGLAGQTLVDVQQIIYALERAECRLRDEADQLMQAHDYSAEFPAEDADRMREAIALLRLDATTRAALFPRSLLPDERECCGTFFFSPHRATCRVRK